MNKPESNASRRRFWQFMSEQQNQWRNGDPLAIGRAIVACSYAHRPPPAWLRDAVITFLDRRITPAEERLYRELDKHRMRWRAVKELRQQPKPPVWRKCWSEAAKNLKGTPWFASASTIQDSYILIQAAGGKRVTLESYRLAAKKRNQHKKAKHKLTAK